MTMYEYLDNKNIKQYSLYERDSKVKLDDFGRPVEKKASFEEFLESLPNILAGKDLREIARIIAETKKKGNKFLIGMGAHVIKVGLSPLIIDLMQKGIVNGIAMNGACTIHDTEIALVGHTSEDVAKEIANGTFGMVKETTEFITEAVKRYSDLGCGEAIGRALLESNVPYKDKSILAMAYKMSIPVTVHIAIGTDIIHMHPQFDGAVFGSASHRDFLVFSKLVSQLERGVYLNLGSSVILPEVFLKAVSLVRNLGYSLKDITTINMDFIQHYRPLTNVVRRPTLESGKGFSLTGHHEIMFPLLCAAIKHYL
jgi:deoxyhypusine synthase